MSEPVKRLPLKTLEEWKRKAAACDQAREFLRGRADSEELQQLDRILAAAEDTA